MSNFGRAVRARVVEQKTSLCFAEFQLISFRRDTGMSRR